MGFSLRKLDVIVGSAACRHGSTYSLPDLLQPSVNSICVDEFFMTSIFVDAAISVEQSAINSLWDPFK